MKSSSSCLLLGIFVLFGGCSADQMERKDLLVSLAFVPPSDAPVVSVAEIYPDLLLLKEVGGRVWTSRPTEATVVEIQRLLMNLDTKELQTSSKVGHHRGEIWLSTEGDQIGFLIGQIPPSVWELLLYVDELFVDSFSRRYRFRFVTQNGFQLEG